MRKRISNCVRNVVDVSVNGLGHRVRISSYVMGNGRKLDEYTVVRPQL